MTEENIISEEPYNRLVIIGNGFDIALGLKTSYQDFILDYIKKSIITAVKEDKSGTELLFVRTNMVLVERIKEIFNKLPKNNVKAFIEGLQPDIEIILNKKYSFFIDLVNECDNSDWVGIEQFYFNKLMNIYIHASGGGWKKTLHEIMLLNQCMDILTRELNKYIIEQQNLIHIAYLNSPLSSVIDKIVEPLNEKTYKLLRKEIRKEPPLKTIYLNFNYTNCINRLINSSFAKLDSIFISIHGYVNNPHNPIIFGYGDDTSEDYKKLELDGNRELLRKIKSFQYQRTDNYHNLLYYLDEYEFDVFVIGHSCGVSDRTMLKTIFEHDNCFAIKRFYYKDEEEDFYKRMEIARHFSDKIKMRERLLPFDELARIPQSK